MPKCSHCKTDFKNKSEFRVRGSKRYSPYCTLCRDIAEQKKATEDDNGIRPYTEHEEKLVKRYLKKLKAKEKKEKLPITHGKIICP